MGAKQLVVQLAFEMMLCAAASYLSSFTPSTMVMSSLVAGAEMMTFLTVVPRCAFALVASVKKPVDSTISAPTEAQSSFAGSRSAKTLIFLPSIAMKSSPEVISCFRLPRMESYFSRWANVAGVVRSLTATNSMSGLPIAVRKTLRPMRPKPLIPTFTAMMCLLLKDCARIASRMSGMCVRLSLLGGYQTGVSRANFREP